jgi:hypothetical protein
MKRLDSLTDSELNTELVAEAGVIAADVERLTKQADALAAERDQVVAHSAVIAELATVLLGDATEGSRASADAFRAALRRLFVCLETHFSG